MLWAISLFCFSLLLGIGFWSVMVLLLSIRADVRSLHYIFSFLPARSTSRMEVGLFSEHHLNLDQIPSALLYGVLLSEDSNFFVHRGWQGQATGIRKSDSDGGTIHERMAKYLFLQNRHPILQKILALPYAMVLDKEFSKKEILALYLSAVEWGDGIYGLRAATKHYFQKEISFLSFEESVYLATLLQDPRNLDSEFRLKKPLSLENSNRMARSFTHLLMLNRNFETGEMKGFDPLISREGLYSILRRAYKNSLTSGESTSELHTKAQFLLSRFSTMYLKPASLKTSPRTSAETSVLFN